MQTPQWQWKQGAFSHPIIKTKIADLEKLAAGRSHNSKDPLGAATQPEHAV